MSISKRVTMLVLVPFQPNYMQPVFNGRFIKHKTFGWLNGEGKINAIPDFVLRDWCLVKASSIVPHEGCVSFDDGVVMFIGHPREVAEYLKGYVTDKAIIFSSDANDVARTGDYGSSVGYSIAISGDHGTSVVLLIGGSGSAGDFGNVNVTCDCIASVGKNGVLTAEHKSRFTAGSGSVIQIKYTLHKPYLEASYKETVGQGKILPDVQFRIEGSSPVITETFLTAKGLVFLKT